MNNAFFATVNDVSVPESLNFRNPFSLKPGNLPVDIKSMFF